MGTHASDARGVRLAGRANAPAGPDPKTRCAEHLSPTKGVRSCWGSTRGLGTASRRFVVRRVGGRDWSYASRVTTWIARLDDAPGGAGAGPRGPRVAVKDAIDVVGVPTTAGSRAVASDASPALNDAACLAGFRAAGCVVVGKTNLHELCFGTSGVNPWFGTPVNPHSPDRIPGGSSSGSAVAVAAGEADLALGTDTGGSVRVPAACCGIVGLKTTWGRVPTAGVWPLSPSLDTVGPLAADVAGVTVAMGLLDPRFEIAPRPARVVGRLRIEGVNERVEAAIDEALAAAGFAVRELELPGWDASDEPFRDVLLSEFWQAHARLVSVPDVSDSVVDGLRMGSRIDGQRRAAARDRQSRWRHELVGAFSDVDVLALPTLLSFPPTFPELDTYPSLTRLTSPANVAGVPALAMPVRVRGGPVPASLQLVGPPNSEELLCATGLTIEAATTPSVTPTFTG